MAHHDQRLPTCANCGYDFTATTEPDQFCPRCGQQNHSLDLSFGHVVEELLEGIFHFDGKVFQTARLLLTRPGELTRRFLDGHRVPYVPPVRLYIFISFVLFFLLSLQVGHDRKKVLKNITRNLDDGPRVLSAQDSAALARLGAQPDKLRQMQRADSLLTRQSAARDFSLNLPVGDSSITTADVASLPEEPEPAQVDSVIISKGGHPGWLSRLAVRRAVRWRDATAEDIGHQLVRAASVLSFFLMPLAALLLKLFYLRRRWPYLSHLIFTVHVQCFLFLLFALVIGLQLMHVPESVLNPEYVLLIGAVYFVLALRNVYRQSWAKTLVKSLLLSFVYSLTLVLTLALVLVIGVTFF